MGDGVGVGVGLGDAKEMVTVVLLGEPTEYPLPDLIVKVAVFVPLVSELCRAVRVTLAERAPAGITTLSEVPLRV